MDLKYGSEFPSLSCCGNRAKSIDFEYPAQCPFSVFQLGDTEGIQIVENNPAPSSSWGGDPT